MRKFRALANHRKSIYTRSGMKQKRLKLINLKTNDREFKALTKQANKYTKGNISKLLRTAGLTFKSPKKVA